MTDTAVPARLADPAEEVDRLRSTFATGRTRARTWRTRQLRGLERMLAEREDEFAAALASDLGRPAVEAWLADLAPAAAESRYARRHLRRWMRRRRAGLPPSVLPGRAHYEYEPLGVVLVIGPWNYPAYLTLAPLVAAPAAGNCAVVTPSEYAPATADLLAALLPAYLDPDAVAVVPGGPAETQELLAQGPDQADELRANLRRPGLRARRRRRRADRADRRRDGAVPRRTACGSSTRARRPGWPACSTVAAARS